MSSRHKKLLIESLRFSFFRYLSAQKKTHRVDLNNMNNSSKENQKTRNNSKSFLVKYVIKLTLV